MLGRTRALPSPSSAFLSLSAVIPKPSSLPQLFHFLCFRAPRRFSPGCSCLKNKALAGPLEGEAAVSRVQLEGFLAGPPAARTRARCEPCAWHQPGLAGRLPGPAHLQQEKHISAQAWECYCIFFFFLNLHEFVPLTALSKQDLRNM